jgi:FkbM family methyltransferase
MTKMSLLIPAFFSLPFSIQRKVLSHFVNRMFRFQSSNHQIIWTSLFYFVAENNIKLTEHAHRYHVDTGQMQAHLRKGNSSDIFVYFQIFIRREYDPLFQFLKKHNVKVEKIIDAGANIGLFSIAALQHFPESNIQAIEPDSSNCTQLKSNIRLNSLSDHVEVHECALWVRNARLNLIADNHWSMRVVEASSESRADISGIPLKQLLERSQWTDIDLLKLDVEGTEMILFNDGDFTELLPKIKVIAMEIHDSSTGREAILKALGRYQFEFFHSGEMTVAWNTRILKNN